MQIPIDYTTLRFIWWLLLGLLLIGFAVMDGFDLGVGILLHRVAKTNDERRVLLNTIGPVWEGNQVWFILGGGAIFAAWPEVYAISFSGFYFAMLAILLALILRPVGIKYRGKIANPRWQQWWDFCLFLSGFIPALIFGVAIGNVLQGIPFYYDESLRSFYTGTFLELLNPFALLCGLISVCMLAMHGGSYLALKTTDIIQARAKSFVYLFATATVILFAIAGWFIATRIVGYHVNGVILSDGPSNPLNKTVIQQTGTWITNYLQYPFTLAAPISGFSGAILAMLLTRLACHRLAWLMSAMAIIGIIATVGVSMFPFILPSSLHPNMSLLVWDASSSHLTLFIMLIVTILFLPLIILYTSWVYYIMRGKVTIEYVNQNQKTLY